MDLISLSSKAIEHFVQLLQAEPAGTNIRVDIENPNTQRADLQLTFCPAGAELADDCAQQVNGFIIYLSIAAQTALQEAVIDFVEDQTGCQLSIKAPYLKGKPPGVDSTLHELVAYALKTEINPNLASHGGMVSLVDITEDGTVLLKFGGGCHGCGMADVTLKQGIETKLKQKFPEITAVCDITDHASGTNPYL